MIITDKLPATALLDENNQPLTGFVPQGNIPIPLTETQSLRFQITPFHNFINKIRLRFATYCRINHCHITLEMQAHTHCLIQFNACYLVDNEYTDLTLPLPQSCTPQEPVIITLYSLDATKDDLVALWCSKTLPPFAETIEFQSMDFTASTPPRVSIVIPVFNKALYTYNCLLTLQHCDPTLSKEIIIVNNASTDETHELLAQLQGSIKIVNNVENLGFVEACCQGAALAEGEFVLFLNNDTQVTEHWLTHLVKVMDDDPAVGITGSKLIYPDGRLQEAGGIIFNDASGWNYGRFFDPTDPEFDYSRVVDYCSGASLMIRKSLWETLGGFDKRYAPAYYEDTDLCFAVRQAGYKVVYCHNSEVIHHEGITAGTDLNSGYKAFQIINHAKFQQKWQTVLTTHFPPGTEPTQAARRLVT
jgi:GT2 family glycosyltransferase